MPLAEKLSPVASVKSPLRWGADRWTPNGLRHLAATAIRARFGVEAAQAVLGHSDVKTTQIYAEVDMSTADRVAAEMG